MMEDGLSVDNVDMSSRIGVALTVALIASLVVLIAIAVVPMQPSDGAESGTCGDGLEWVLDDEGALTITGEG